MTFLEIIQANREKFLKFNDIKYQRFMQLLPHVNARRTISAIPYLLSLNHGKLPGYVEGLVPVGVANYLPDEDTKRYLRAKFPTARIDITHASGFVEMLAVMGSVGTIAYNKKSDFDFWVCVNRRNVTDEMYVHFARKVEAIQKWASLELEVPVHLFLNNIDSIKLNIFAEDEDEAFGSTTGAVLKDEFFRSSIILAGKVPFWWVLPTFVRDDEYERLLESVPEDLREAGYVDLGNLYEITREDFLGAALFQIIKSLGNPFKSIIKIGVLEKYLFGSTDSPLLSQKVKLNILRGSLDNTILDAYLLMFNEVFNYYSTTIVDKGLLNILRQNLYLKTDPQLSRYLGIKDKKNIPYKVVVMFQFVKEWGWDLAIIRDLDNFENWDFNKIMKFWDSVKRFMLLSYQKIATQFPTLNLAKKISESDFMLLSRKIKTHFTQEPEKIEQFITFKDTHYESILYLEPVSQGIHEVEWRLYKRNTSEKNVFLKTTIKAEKNLLKLLVWTAINQIYDPVFSRMNIQSGYTRINQNLVTELLNQIYNFFAEQKIKIKNEYFLSPMFTLFNLIIINFNMENVDTVHSIHHLYHTSWGESYLKEYQPEEALIQVLYTVLRDGLKHRKKFDNYCIINTPEPFKKHYKRIINIFREAYAFMVENEHGATARFITRFGDKFIDIRRESDKLTVSVYPNIIKLLTALTLQPRKNTTLKFYSDEPSLDLLDTIYAHAGKQTISVFYEERGAHLLVYIVNEAGNLFTFIRPAAGKELFLNVMWDFCQNIMKRVNERNGPTFIDKNRFRLFAVRTDRFGKVTIGDETQTAEQQYLKRFNSKSSLIASVSRSMGEETFYNILFPDNVSSGYMTVRELYSVGGKVTDLRGRGEEISGIIRDLVFVDLKKTEEELGSNIYFLEKYKLEFMIDKAGMKP